VKKGNHNTSSSNIGKPRKKSRKFLDEFVHELRVMGETTLFRILKLITDIAGSEKRSIGLIEVTNWRKNDTAVKWGMAEARTLLGKDRRPAAIRVLKGKALRKRKKWGPI